MTTIEKIEHEHGYIFKIYLGEDLFTITFAGNLDLYWSYVSKNILEENTKTLTITKENFFLYELIKELYERIRDYNFDDVLFSFDDEARKKFRERKILEDRNNTEKLFHDGIVDYHSDDGVYDEVSSFQIKELEDSYEITFTKGVVNGNFQTFSVRICNSGSRYEHFRTLFMRMYNKMVRYDQDFNQVTIDEYIYSLKRTRKHFNVNY